MRYGLCYQWFPNGNISILRSTLSGVACHLPSGASALSTSLPLFGGPWPLALAPHFCFGTPGSGYGLSARPDGVGSGSEASPAWACGPRRSGGPCQLSLGCRFKMSSLRPPFRLRQPTNPCLRYLLVRLSSPLRPFPYGRVHERSAWRNSAPRRLDTNNRWLE